MSGPRLQSEMEVLLRHSALNGENAGFAPEALEKDAQARKRLLGFGLGSLVLLGLCIALL